MTNHNARQPLSHNHFEHRTIAWSTVSRLKRNSKSMIFPNESQEYRDARDALLRQEVELMRQLEAVTAQRQSLPPGGEIPEDYVFDRIGDDGAPTGVRMSELFGDSDTLMLYSPMFPRLCGDDRPIPTHGIFAELPVDQTPCPSCAALVDMWDGMYAQLDGLGGKLAIVAKSPIEQVATFARERGWHHIQVLSAAKSTFTGRSRISRRGRPRLRLAAWRAAWGALPHNPVMAARYRYLTTRQHNRLTDGQARAAIAAALLRWIHIVITRRVHWDAAIAGAPELPAAA